MSKDSRTQTEHQHDDAATTAAPSAGPQQMMGGVGQAAMQRRVRQRAETGRQGVGMPLDAGVRAKMERAFGASFDDVRVHEGPEAAAIGAQAYAEGHELHFAPGQYQPGTPHGDELIGHELTHVVQQRGGSAPAGAQGKNATGIGSDASLEAEADHAGAIASRGGSVQVHGVGAGIQRKDKLRTPSGTFDQGKAKSGTEGSIMNAQALMDASPASRAKNVWDILAKYDDSINTLQRVSKWLMGPPIKDEFKTVPENTGKGELSKAISDHFGGGSIIAHTGKPRAQYLLDLVEHGKPSAYSKLLLSLGVLDNSGAHPNEVIEIVDNAESSDVEPIRDKLLTRIKAIAPGGTDAKAGASSGASRRSSRCSRPSTKKRRSWTSARRTRCTPRRSPRRSITSPASCSHSIRAPASIGPRRSRRWRSGRSRRRRMSATRRPRTIRSRRSCSPSTRWSTATS